MKSLWDLDTGSCTCAGSIGSVPWARAQPSDTLSGANGPWKRRWGRCPRCSLGSCNFVPSRSLIRYGGADRGGERMPRPPRSLTECCYFLCGGSPISCTLSQSPCGHPGVHPPGALSVVRTLKIADEGSGGSHSLHPKLELQTVTCLSAHKAYFAGNETSDQKLPLLLIPPPGQAAVASSH